MGEGTTIRLYLPRHEGASAANEGDTSATPLTLLEDDKTVLVVDDEATVRMLVTDVLKDSGYSVVEAGDGPSGFKILSSDTKIDLLITDVGLPGGMNGHQLAEAGRDFRPGLKTLFITGYAENAAIGNGPLPPGMQVLTKPFSIDALAGRIRELMKA